MKTALIIAPFWRQPGHVGNYRVDRFVRWLAEDGYHVVLARGGSADGEKREPWGLEVTVRDPLGIYRDPGQDGAPAPPRKPSPLRRSLAYWMLNPDPGVIWARRVCAHPPLLRHATAAAMVLSSSPPESTHVAAGKLSRQLGIPHIVDLRDGWLDEPLKPILRSSAVRQWLEGRLEKILLGRAESILVTSDVWRELLCERMPEVASKVTVLTNGYPRELERAGGRRLPTSSAGRRLELLHAGQFLGSRSSHIPDLLLQPLLDGVRQSTTRGIIRLVGSLTGTDRDCIERFERAFQDAGWTIECQPPLPRQEILSLLEASDGLLLLSASNAAIPSKLFEYIVAKRPILAVTERDSATWRLCVDLPQCFLIDIKEVHQGPISRFIAHASCNTLPVRCPIAFTEARLRAQFSRVASTIAYQDL